MPSDTLSAADHYELTWSYDMATAPKDKELLIAYEPAPGTRYVQACTWADAPDTDTGKGGWTAGAHEFETDNFIVCQNPYAWAIPIVPEPRR